MLNVIGWMIKQQQQRRYIRNKASGYTMEYEPVSCRALELWNPETGTQRLWSLERLKDTIKSGAWQTDFFLVRL